MNTVFLFYKGDFLIVPRVARSNQKTGLSHFAYSAHSSTSFRNCLRQVLHPLSHSKIIRRKRYILF
jgi:hypothetical protein